jgi:hypothetical protein
MVCSVQTVSHSCTNTNIVSKSTKMRFHMTHVTYEFHEVCPKLFMSLWYVQCKPYTYPVSRLALSPNGPNWAPPDPCHLRVPSGVSKIIYELVVRSAQTEHLSFTKAKTISKQNETRFHMTHVTKEFHRVPLILFLSLWYVWRKSCTILASRVALSPNVLNRASTWASSPKSPIECVQNDFYAYGTFGVNHAPILHWR